MNGARNNFFYSRFGYKDDRLPLCGKPSVLHADTTSNQLLLFVARFYARFFRQRHIVGFPCNCNCEKCCVHQMSCFPAVIVKRLYVYQNDFRIQKKITVFNVNVLISRNNLYNFFIVGDTVIVYFINKLYEIRVTITSLFDTTFWK